HLLGQRRIADVVHEAAPGQLFEEHAPGCTGFRARAQARATPRLRRASTNRDYARSSQNEISVGAQLSRATLQKRFPRRRMPDVPRELHTTRFPAAHNSHARLFKKTNSSTENPLHHARSSQNEISVGAQLSRATLQKRFPRRRMLDEVGAALVRACDGRVLRACVSASVFTRRRSRLAPAKSSAERESRARLSARGASRFPARGSRVPRCPLARRPTARSPVACALQSPTVNSAGEEASCGSGSWSWPRSS